MADSNDDLLEDGDLSEANFDVLDLAQEDALLADDDENTLRDSFDMRQEDEDDYLELGGEEDLDYNDDELLENGSSGTKRRLPDIEYNNNDNDDSDDNSGGERSRFKSERQITSTADIPETLDDSDDNSGGERSRFKSERQITSTSSTRNTADIPETLDAVAVRNPIVLPAKRGGWGGGRGGGGGGRGGGAHQNWKFNNQQHNQQHIRQHQPNIHVNPHFRPRLPHHPPGGWNPGGVPFRHPPPHHHPGGYPAYPPPPPPHLPPPPPPQGTGGWSDGGFYGSAGGPPPFSQPSPVGDGANYPSAPHQPQMGWGDDFYQGPPPPPAFGPGHYPPPHPMGGGPGWTRPPFGPPRPPFRPPRPPFPNQNRFPGMPRGGGQSWPHNKQRGGKLGGGGSGQPQHNKPPPAKQAKLEAKLTSQAPSQQTDGQHRVWSNLLEIKVVSVPPDISQQEKSTEVEEDEEMKAYRKKIEEQKKLREKILLEKEKKRRMVATNQKALETGGVTGVPPPAAPTPPVTTPQQVETKLVRIRTKDGSTVLKRLTLDEIKKLTKVVPNPQKSASPQVSNRVVAVENLSASTTAKQLQGLAVQIGPIEKVELDQTKNIATIRFVSPDSAKTFVTKYHRKMIDLSMICVKFVQAN